MWRVKIWRATAPYIILTTLTDHELRLFFEAMSPEDVATLIKVEIERIGTKL